MMHCLSLILIILIAAVPFPPSAVAAEDPYEEVIDEVGRDKIDSLIDELEYIAVIFYTKNCKACELALAELEYIDDDLQKYGVKIVKVNNVEEAKEHGVEHFPSLIFWRKEVPILYEGKMSDKEVLHWIIHNKKSDVEVLHDKNFEKRTEAASGASTGDWFVLFYEPNDKKCIQVMPVWEAVGVRLNHKMTVAKVDVEANDVLDQRFSITELPTILFFRQGKMYRFNQEIYDTQSLVSFASRWYKSSKSERVPKVDPDDPDHFLEFETRNFFLSVAAATLGLIVAATSMIVIFIGLGYLKINQDKFEREQAQKYN